MNEASFSIYYNVSMVNYWVNQEVSGLKLT